MCFDIVLLCLEFFVVYLDKLKEIEEFGKKFVVVRFCCVEYGVDSVEDLLDLLDSGVSYVIFGKEYLDGFC